MSLAFALADSGSTDGPGSSFASNSYAFQNNKLYYAYVNLRASTARNVSSISGGGITWVKVADAGTSPYGSLYRGLVTSGASTGALTFTLSGAATSADWHVIEVTGYDDSGGSNGSAATVQSATNNGTGTSGSVTLASFADATNNAALGFFGHNATEGTTPGTGFTELGDVSGAVSPIQSTQTEYKIGEDLSVDASWASSGGWAAFAVEVKAAVGGGSTHYDQTIGRPTHAPTLRGLESLIGGLQDIGRPTHAPTLRGLVDIWSYRQTFETDSVATVFPAAQGTTASIATDQAKFGTHSLKITETGSASGSTRNLPTGTRKLAIRFWFRLSATPGATQTIFNFNVAGVSGLVVRVSTSGAIQVGFNGGTFQSGGTITLNSWHSVDLKLDVSTASFTCDWRFDDAAKTQATIAGTAGDLSWKVANAGANTLNLWIDAVQLVGDLTQYPLTDAIFGGGGSNAYVITVGHLPTAAAIRGLESSIGGFQAIGKVTHSPTLRGLDPGTIASSVDIGRIASAATLRGLELVKTVLLAIGFINTPSTAIGVCSLGQTNQSLGGTTVADIEAKLGRRFTGLRQNQSITVHSVSVANSQYDLGYVVSYRNQETDNPGDWALTAAGGFDADLDALYASLVASGRWTTDNPFLLGYHHEQTVDNATQTGYPTNGTQQDYIDGYRAWAEYLDEIGASVTTIDGVPNGGIIKRVWCPWAKMFHSSHDPGESADDFDPNLGTSPVTGGRRYYDFAALDYYNPPISAGVLKYTTDPATVLDTVIAKCEQWGVDFLIPEIGCDLTGFTDQASIDAKAEWIDNLHDYLVARGETGPGVCRGLWLTSSDAGGDYRVDDYPESLAAYRRLVNDDYFGGGPAVRGADFGALTGTQTIGRPTHSPTLRGLGHPLTGTQDIGHFTHTSTLRGLGSPLSGTQTIGHLTHAPTLRGFPGFTVVSPTRPPLLTVSVLDPNTTVATLNPNITVPSLNASDVLSVYNPEETVSALDIDINVESW